MIRDNDGRELGYADLIAEMRRQARTFATQRLYARHLGISEQHLSNLLNESERAVSSEVIRRVGFWDARPKSGAILSTFWNNVRVMPSGCWEWAAHRDKRKNQGYGVTHLRGNVPVRAHRVAYEIANATEVPLGMFVCHSCDNPPCVNPAHLWIGSVKDNARDCSVKGRTKGHKMTHCKRGHEFTPENTAPAKGPSGVGRRCRTCTRALAKKNRLTRIARSGK